MQDINNAEIFKSLSDPNRLTIIKMLSHGELCACEILEELKITQPTLSHHMGVLCKAGLVLARKEGKWMHYTLNSSVIKHMQAFFGALLKSDAVAMQQGVM